MDAPSIIMHDESVSSTDFCQLMLSSTDIPLDGCRSEYNSSMQGGVAITMILQNVCRETASARNFYDQTRGPYFGEGDTDFFQPFKFDGLMTGNNMPPISSRGEVPLEKIIKHVVATIRVSSVSMIPMQDVGVGVSVAKVGEKWLMIKARKNSQKDMSPSSSGKKRKRSETSNTCSEPSSQQPHHQQTVYYQYDKKSFYSQEVLRQKQFPVTVRHGSLVFCLPLAFLILRIAEELCIYQGVHKYPIAVDSYTPEKLDPYILYLFPPFQISTRLPEFIYNKETNPFHHPQEKYYGVIVDHLRDVLCDGDPISYTLMETWLAEMMFNPRAKYPICPIISGPMGVGKSKFFDFLGRRVFGLDTVAMPSNLGQCAGRFNSILKNKILMVINEEDMNKSDQVVKIMRTLCTEVNHCIEEKHVNIKANVEIWSRFCILTNDPDPYQDMSINERRFVTIMTKSTLPSGEYFDRLYDAIDTEKTSVLTAIHFVAYLAEIRRNRAITCPVLKANGSGTSEEAHTSIPNPVNLQESPYEEETGPSTCKCRIPHKYIHTGLDGYTPARLRKPVMTEYMMKKIIGNMPALHFFLYTFVIRKTPLLTLLSDNLQLLHERKIPIPPHRDIGDLRFIEFSYFHTCYKLYKDHVYKKPRHMESYSPLMDTAPDGGYEDITVDLDDLFDTTHDPSIPRFTPTTTTTEPDPSIILPKRRGRPKRTTEAAPVHMSMEMMYFISSTSKELVVFIGDRNKCIEAPSTLSTESHLHTTDNQVIHTSVNTRDGMKGAIKYLNLSGASDSFSRMYKEAYAYLGRIMKEVSDGT
jgi:hypothetical protein